MHIKKIIRIRERVAFDVYSGSKEMKGQMQLNPTHEKKTNHTVHRSIEFQKRIMEDR